MKTAKELTPWESLPDGVVFVTHYAHGPDLVECQHPQIRRVTTIFKTELCAICKGDEFTTANFVRPVKMLVRLPESARSKQASLF